MIDAEVTWVVMAKGAVPGRVKTRLCDGPGALTPGAAARVHRAMLTCVMGRVGGIPGRGRGFRGVLAVDGPTWHDAGALPVQVPGGWTVVEQGEGGLGERIDRVWRQLGGGPAVWLGVDSPDVPAEHLRAAWAVAAGRAGAHAAVGPVDDGGYWTLSASRRLPTLLRRIDWGSERVYDQTHAAARGAGLRLIDLPAWHDVDAPDDLHDLARRLNRPDPPDPLLATLAQALPPAPTSPRR